MFLALPFNEALARGTVRNGAISVAANSGARQVALNKQKKNDKPLSLPEQYAILGVTLTLIVGGISGLGYMVYKTSRKDLHEELD